MKSHFKFLHSLLKKVVFVLCQDCHKSMLKLEKWTCIRRILSEFTAVSTEVVQHSLSLAYTVVSTKVVQKKRKRVRDNAERWSGKYPIDFNKS